MAALILKMSVSLDGYVAPADGSSDWEAAGRSPDGAEWVLDTVSNAGAHLVGAVTYARWAALWPSASGPFAAPMNNIPKVVFSNSLTQHTSSALANSGTVSGHHARRQAKAIVWTARIRVGGSVRLVAIAMARRIPAAKSKAIAAAAGARAAALACESHDSFELRAAMPEHGDRAAAVVRKRPALAVLASAAGRLLGAWSNIGGVDECASRSTRKR